MAKKLIELKNIKKSYGTNTILEDYSMAINENEFVTILGPSGCGKTTTLRIIGGFESVDNGEVLLDGERIDLLPSHKRPINTVFQRYALFPHYSIFDNVAFGLVHNIYSNVFDIGIINLMEENNIDEEEIGELSKQFNKILKPKEVLNKAIEVFSEKSLVIKVINELNAVKKEKVKYDELINNIIKEHNLEVYLNKDTYNNIILELTKKDIYYEMILKIKDKKFKQNTINTEVLKSLKLVGLEGYESRTISQLSGGQMQRVAIARAIVNKPRILLLDEPLAALDLKLRQSMRYELKAMQKNLGITFIFITHDQEEAMVMSDTVVVMNKGEIQQIGRPEDIYNSPVNRCVADFIGQSNMIEGTYLGKDRLSMLGKTFKVSVNDFVPNDKVYIIVENEDFDVVPLEGAKLTGVVKKRKFKKNVYELQVLVDGKTINVVTTEKFSVEDEIGLTIDANNIYTESINQTKEALLNNYDGDNIIEGIYLGENTVSFLGQEFEAYIQTFTKDEMVDVVIRPEDFDLEFENPSDAILQGVVQSSVFTGVHFEIIVNILDKQIIVHDYQNVSVGTIIGLRVDAHEIHLMKHNEN
ncbi:MAG: ATP-binding cassette domain-containing protein [bacterium]